MRDFFAGTGERIGQVITHKRMKQKDISEKIGISQSFLSDVVRGKTSPNLKLLSGISIYMPDIDMRWVLTGEGTMTGNQPTETIESAIDMEQLAEVIELVELAMARAGITSSRRKAELVVAVYEFCLGEGVPTDRAPILKLISAMAR